MIFTKNLVFQLYSRAKKNSFQHHVIAFTKEIVSSNLATPTKTSQFYEAFCF